MTELCEDEGCLHYGTPHVCIKGFRIRLRRIKWKTVMTSNYTFTERWAFLNLNYDPQCLAIQAAHGYEGVGVIWNFPPEGWPE